VLPDAFDDLIDATGLEERLPTPGEGLRLTAPPGAATAGVAAALARRHAPAVLVAGTPGGAERLLGDLRELGGELHPVHFPQRESLPHEDSDPHVEITARRVDALAALLGGRTDLVVTTARALAERTPLPARSEEISLLLEVGSEAGRERLAARLGQMGFERVHTVSELGEFAVRGGILDLFPFGSEGPLRLELWGDEIASIRRFDPLSQRSVESLSRVEVLPVDLRDVPSPDEGEGGDPGPVRTERKALVEILPERTLLLELEEQEGSGGGGRERRLRLWEETREGRTGAGALPTGALVVPPERAESLLSAMRRIVFTRDPESDAPGLGVAAPPPIHREMSRLVDAIAAAHEAGEEVVVLCDNTGQLERLEEILEERGGRSLAAGTSLALGSLSGGFRLPVDPPLLVLTDHEIFERRHRVRRDRRTRGGPTLESVASLRPGDYVVHLDHGIGRYAGLERVEIGGEAIETLKIEYADGEALRVPHYRLDLIERYSTGPEGSEPEKAPTVHKLGGRKWKKLKQRTVDSIQETAAELLELYAYRQVADGHAFAGDTKWQVEMESAFLYEETADQLRAWEEIRSDMEEPHPMDRLLCGDVGFGKTEVAMRAAFKAVQDGKQVAVLAPTTVLVEQHLHTFRERLAGFPVRIEPLSRFQTRAEQAEVLDRVAQGSTDIVIGTHRLLSDDVDFRDLGLLIVDEEQRFGVRQKERLKRFKRAVDVLTMTATPIPRTMQLALGELRDLSVIETPPRDRMPVITHVLHWSDGILRDAMRREIDRGGQVFFVHHRVRTIETVAERVRRLVPDATVAVAHGQMPERELEGRMSDLVEGEVDVLVSTSIIENGLDVPTANTMIVHRAESFGLSQLYQLRGRIGRSHRRAYCYLVVPADVTPEAERRLKILEHHTELGSGYRVALRDLELRGAGNLLGESQSGFARAVGFETYRRLLEKTVSRMAGEEAGRPEPPEVTVAGDAYLPDDYVLDTEQKMDLYRRISRLDDREEARELGEELRDRFGPLPGPAERLLASLRLKLLGTAIGARSIHVSEESARINFREDALPRMALLRDAFHDRQIDVDVRRTRPLSLVLKQAGVGPLLPTVGDALAVLARTEEVGTPAAAKG